jgi:hypothetical protein
MTERDEEIEFENQAPCLLNTRLRSCTASAAGTHSSALSTMVARANPLSPDEADLNITQCAIEPLLKDQSVLIREPLMVLREAVGRNGAEQRIAEIFEVGVRLTHSKRKGAAWRQAGPSSLCSFQGPVEQGEAQRRRRRRRAIRGC